MTVPAANRTILWTEVGVDSFEMGVVHHNTILFVVHAVFVFLQSMVRTRCGELELYCPLITPRGSRKG